MTKVTTLGRKYWEFHQKMKCNHHTVGDSVANDIDIVLVMSRFTIDLTLMRATRREVCVCVRAHTCSHLPMHLHVSTDVC